MAERSPRCLQWHFTIPGSASTAVVLCYHRFARLIGYAVVRHTIDHKTSLRTGLLANILVEQDDPDVIASLLEAA